MPCIRKTRFDQDYFFKQQQNKVILKENYKMEPNQKKANGLALIPFAVFVGVYLATGITLNAMGVEMVLLLLLCSRENLMTSYLFSFTVVEKKIS